MKATVYYNPGSGYGQQDKPNKTIEFEGNDVEQIKRDILAWYRKAGMIDIKPEDDFDETLKYWNNEAYDNVIDTLAVIYKVEIDGQPIFVGNEPVIEWSDVNQEYVMTGIKTPDGNFDKIDYKELWGYDPMTEPKDGADSDDDDPAQDLYDQLNNELN